MCFQECSNIFSKGGGEELAKLTGSTFLGKTNRIQVHALQLCGHEVSFNTATECPSRSGGMDILRRSGGELASLPLKW